MAVFKWLASITLAAAILPALHGEPRCPGNVASLRLRLVERSQIIVPVTINRAGSYDFLVDTGAQVTSIDPALAAELRLGIEGTTGFVGVGFRTRPSFAHLNLLEAGSHAVGNTLVVVQNLDRFQAADPHIRGILGGNFLERFDVLIDYAHSMLCLDDAKVMQAEMKGKHIGLVSPPRLGEGTLSTEPLIIPVHLTAIPGRSLLQLLDSGTNVPFLYDSGKDIAGGFSVSTPIRDRGPDGAERAFAVLPPAVALLAGSLVSAVSGFVLVRLCGGSHQVAVSMMPKAVTTPIAIAVSQHTGGDSSLTVVFAVLGGVLVAAVIEIVFHHARVKDWRAYGFAAGTAGSGIGTARVMEMHSLAGAFAGLAIGVNGVVTSLLVPVLAQLLHNW